MNNNTKSRFHGLIRRARRCKYLIRKTLSPIIPIIISISSIVVALRANAIYEGQREVAKKAAAPFIDIASQYDENGNVNRIEIVNSGGLLGEMNIEFYPYIYYTARLFYPGDLSSRDVRCLCPIMIKSESSVEDTLKARPEYKTINLFKILAPHTKIGTLYEIRNTEYMNHLSEMMSEMYHTLWVKGIEEKDGNYKITDSLTDEHAFTLAFFSILSIEYMVKIDYTSLVEDEPRTEIFRVSTGIGVDNTKDGNKIIPGVSIVKEGSMEMEMFNIISMARNEENTEEEYLLMKGTKDTVNSDIENLTDYLFRHFINRQYILGSD